MNIICVVSLSPIAHALSLSPRRIRVSPEEVSCVAPEFILSSLVDVPEALELQFLPETQVGAGGLAVVVVVPSLRAWLARALLLFPRMQKSAEKVYLAETTEFFTQKSSKSTIFRS